VNIHEPRASVAIPVILPGCRRPVIRKFVRELPGRPCGTSRKSLSSPRDTGLRKGGGNPREGEKFPGEIETHVISVTDTG